MTRNRIDKVLSFICTHVVLFVCIFCTYNLQKYMCDVCASVRACVRLSRTFFLDLLFVDLTVHNLCDDEYCTTSHIIFKCDLEFLALFRMQ